MQSLPHHWLEYAHMARVKVDRYLLGVGGGAARLLAPVAFRRRTSLIWCISICFPRISPLPGGGRPCRKDPRSPHAGRRTHIGIDGRSHFGIGGRSQLGTPGRTHFGIGGRTTPESASIATVTLYFRRGVMRTSSGTTSPMRHSAREGALLNLPPVRTTLELWQNLGDALTDQAAATSA